MAAALQALRDPVLQHEVLGQSGDGRHAFRHQGVALEPCSDTAVGQLGMVAHHGGVQVGMMDQTLFADDHVDNSGKPVLIGVEGRQVCRQPVRQHGELLGGGVDRRGVGPGVVVGGAARLDQGVDVGDGHENAGGTVWQRFGDRQLVEVQGIVVVNGTPHEVAQVAGLAIARQHWRHQPVDLGEHLGRKVRQQSPLEHDAVSNLLQDGTMSVFPVDHEHTSAGEPGWRLAATSV